MFEGERGGEGSTTKRFEEFVEAVGPEAYNDVVFHRNIAERSWTEGESEILRRLWLISASLADEMLLL